MGNSHFIQVENTQTLSGEKLDRYQVTILLGVAIESFCKTITILVNNTTQSRTKNSHFLGKNSVTQFHIRPRHQNKTSLLLPWYPDKGKFLSSVSLQCLTLTRDRAMFLKSHFLAWDWQFTFCQASTFSERSVKWGALMDSWMHASWDLYSSD